MANAYPENSLMEKVKKGIKSSGNSRGEGKCVTYILRLLAKAKSHIFSNFMNRGWIVFKITMPLFPHSTSKGDRVTNSQREAKGY